jgi:hypothetical protein
MHAHAPRGTEKEGGAQRLLWFARSSLNCSCAQQALHLKVMADVDRKRVTSAQNGSALKKAKQEAALAAPVATEAHPYSREGRDDGPGACTWTPEAIANGVKSPHVCGARAQAPKILDTILQKIGNTPLVRINK